MEKKKIIEVIHEKVKVANFDDHGKAVLSMDDVGDGKMIMDVLEDLKSDTTFDFDFDLDNVTAFARQRNPDLEIFPISAKTGEGVEALADWLCSRIRTHKEKKKETNA